MMEEKHFHRLLIALAQFSFPSSFTDAAHVAILLNCFVPH